MTSFLEALESLWEQRKRPASWSSRLSKVTLSQSLSMI